MKLLSILKKIISKFETPEKFAKKLGVKIGKNCYISTKGFPSEGYLIEIGDYVRIAGGTSFYTHGGLWSIRHYYKDYTIEHFGKIKIGNYTSIGANCMIMPGITIGNNCIVGGGSVVTKSVPDGCMVAGNPAKFIGYTKDFYKYLKEHNNFACKSMTSVEKKTFLLAQSDEKFIKKKYIKLPEQNY